MLTILYWPHHNTQCILSCLRSQFISASRDPKNITARLNGRELNCMPQMVESQLLSFQNPQILRTISSGHGVIHTQASFHVWGLLWQIWLSYPFRAGVRLHQMTMHLDSETRVVQSLTKVNEKIQLTKND